MAEIEFVRGDITAQHVDAVVNAANSGLLGGGGVDGAIHRAGGPDIMAECDRIRDRQGGCPTSEAVMTPAGRLPARAVIHTVGPRYRDGRSGEAELLAAAYASSLRLARDNGLRTLAFPSISTGVYGYPIDEAAEIAVGTVVETLDLEPAAYDFVRFVLFSDEDLFVYREAYERLSGE